VVGVPLVSTGKMREKGVESRTYAEVLGSAGLKQDGPSALGVTA
jgi:hypothetical protein